VAAVTGLRHIDVQAPDAAICLEAARLRATYNPRKPDAIHAATTIVAKVVGIITNDRRFKRLSRDGLKIWQIDELA
jgi:predicted nucleic acid-binding protein